MENNKKSLPSFIEVVVEARINSTEKEETLIPILRRFINGVPFTDNRFDGTYLVLRDSGDECLQLFGDWIREIKQLDTVRSRLYRSITGNITALYFNRQAAAMGRIALIDVDDQPPLGSISLQIVSDALDQIIEVIAPKTHDGKEMTAEEWQRIKRAKERAKEKRQSYKNKSKF